MGMLDRLERPAMAAVTWTSYDDRWYRLSPDNGETFAGFPIGPDTALRVSAVFACASLIAETLASLPCQLLRRLADGGKEKAIAHRLYRTLRHRPNSWMSPVDFFGSGQMHCGIRGSALAEIKDDGERIELIPLHPDRVTVEQLDSGRLRYQVRPAKGGEARSLSQDRVLHIRDLTLDGLVGQSRAALAREAIAVAGAAEGYVGRFFKYDATGRLVITHPAALNETQRAEWRQTMAENQEGWNNRSRSLHLHSGVTATELGKHDDSGFIIDPRRFQVADIARFWRVPLFMIGLEEKSTTWGTGIEQQKQGFVDFTIKPWADRWAQAMCAALLDEDEQEEYVIEFLFDDLVRGDLKSRAEAFQIFRQIGVLNPDEIRAFQNWGKRDDGRGAVYQDTVPGAPPNAAAPGARPTPSPPPDQGAQDEQDEEAARAIPAPLLADAVARIANREIDDVGRRLARAGEPEQWAAWLVKYYAAQRDYVVKVLAPLAAAYGFESWVVEEVAARVARTAEGLSPAAAPAFLARRREEIERLLFETFEVGAAVAVASGMAEAVFEAVVQQGRQIEATLVAVRTLIERPVAPLQIAAAPPPPGPSLAETVLRETLVEQGRQVSELLGVVRAAVERPPAPIEVHPAAVAATVTPTEVPRLRRKTRTVKRDEQKLIEQVIDEEEVEP